MAPPTEKNDVVMLEQQQTRESEILKPIPRIEKVDYSGAYEVRLTIIPS